ncbi:MAG TPA: sodium:solute symporter, partial [Chitinophagaceae bacterium]
PQMPMAAIPFLMIAFYLFVICLLMQVVLSYIYPVRHTAESAVLYWKSPFEPLRYKGWKGLGNYKLLSVVLLAVMATLYWIFK